MLPPESGNGPKRPKPGDGTGGRSAPSPKPFVKPMKPSEKRKK